MVGGNRMQSASNWAAMSQSPRNSNHAHPPDAHAHQTRAAKRALRNIIPSIAQLTASRIYTSCAYAVAAHARTPPGSEAHAPFVHSALAENAVHYLDSRQG